MGFLSLLAYLRVYGLHEVDGQKVVGCEGLTLGARFWTRIPLDLYLSQVLLIM